MPLFQRRRQQRERAERVARGESMQLTTSFDERCRTRILLAITDNAPEDFGDPFAPRQVNFVSLVRSILVREWGKPTLAKKADAADDFVGFVGAVATDDEMLDVIEAVFEAYDKVNASRDYPRYDPDREANAFRADVNRVLDEHDIAFEVIGREIVPRESAAMHAKVVAPALSLLRGDAGS